MAEHQGVRLYALHASENGDRWWLGWEAAQDRLFVRHEPNAASGGAAVEMDASAFLSRDAGSPQHEALRRLIAAAAGETAGG